MTETQQTATDNQQATSDGLDVAVEELEAWKRRLTITVKPERVARTRERIREELAGQVNLKGFRKGHVPPRIIEERFGPVVDERTVQSLVDQAYREAMAREELDPIGEPRVGNVQYDRGESLTFQAEVEIMPAVRLDRVGGFRVERPEIEVEDEEVTEVLDRLRDEHASWRPADRAPEEGDLVSVRIGPAEKEEELGESDQYRFELGQGYALEEVEDCITTLEPGESGVFDVTFPEDFDDQSMAGREQRLRIELHEVKKKELPPLDDELASQVGDFRDLEALRDAVREDVYRHHEEEAERAVREQLVDGLIEANPFEVPEAMVSSYLDQVIDAPEDAPEEEVAAARQQVRPQAERQIKRHLILDRLVEREGLEATDAEVDERVQELAEERDSSPAAIRRQLAREDQLEQLRRQLAMEKVFDYLKAESTIK